MEKYLVVLNEPNDAIWERVRQNWPNHYILTPRVAVVATESITVAEQIAERLGMNNTEKVFGIVSRMNEYFGFNTPSLWDWLHKVP